MSSNPIVGVPATVKPGGVASLARYWFSRGLNYNQVVAKVHSKFKSVAMKHVYKCSSYWNKVYGSQLDFTKKNYDKKLKASSLPSLKSSPAAIRSTIRIRAKHPVTGMKKEYSFTIDIGKVGTRGELVNEIQRKLMDHFLYYYERRGIREQNIRRLISSMRITSLEGI